MAESPIIECRDLAVGHDGEPVLAGVDLSVRRGESVAILGGSGSGKSTLLRTLSGLLPPIAGTFRLFGRELYESPGREQRELLQRTGVVFQQDALLGSLSLAGNIALPLEQITAMPAPVIGEIVRLKLGMVYLDELADRLPAEVSGGQRRRASVARGSALDPDVLFCDEPTTGLDPVNAAHLESTLLRLRDLLCSTLVIVTHVLETVRAITDRIVMVGNGRICASGTIEELEKSADPDVHAFFHRETAHRKQRSLLGELEREE